MNKAENGLGILAIIRRSGAAIAKRKIFGRILAQYFLILLGFILAMPGLLQSQTKPKLMVSPLPDYSKIQPSVYGLLPRPFDASHLQSSGLQFLAPPSSWDWRAHSGVTPIKDQGTDGSCWAHASLGVFESQILIKDTVTRNFSEFNLVMCNPFGTTCSSGGNDFYSTVFLTSLGTVLEACDPYSKCTSGPFTCNTGCAHISNVLGWRMLANNVAEIKDAVYNIGPVQTTIYASDSNFQTLAAGQVYYYTGTEQTNHSVMIAGYDDTKVHAGGTGAWLIRNSWGTAWSDSGYGWVAYGSARVGENSSVFVQYQDYNANEKIYYYDEKGGNAAVGYGTNTAWGMVRITPTASGILNRVDFWTTSQGVNVSYQIRVYNDFNGTTLSNLIASQDGSCDKAGYYSILLTSPPSVSASDDIFVAIEFTSPNSTFPIPVDYLGVAQTDKSYVSSNGSSWAVSNTYDLAIRARVVPSAGGCGNAICGAGENSSNCCQDCGSCGDAVCCAAAGENGTNCCQDCGSCGDAVCCAAAGENDTNCCQDCGGCAGCDNDGSCDPGETDTNCAHDCGCEAGGCIWNTQAPGGCYCDSVCAGNGDCCADICSVCDYNCPCASGDCCDPVTHKVSPSTTICEPDISIQFACFLGPPKGKCGNDVGERRQNRYCSGSSTACDGDIAFDDWVLHQACSKKQVCNPYTHSCKKKSTCAQHEAPISASADEELNPEEPALSAEEQGEDEEPGRFGCMMTNGSMDSGSIGSGLWIYLAPLLLGMYLRRRRRDKR